jgi:hypothetical protein
VMMIVVFDYGVLEVVEIDMILIMMTWMDGFERGYWRFCSDWRMW